MTQGPAMSREQAERCVSAGIGLALEAAQGGGDIIGAGEMGIGNTTASSAITAALAGSPPNETTGRGTGRNEQEMAHKVAIVERALEVDRPDPNDGLDVLANVGGFEIGVFAGVVLGGALARRALVLNGFVSTVAGLIAHSLCPAVGGYIVASHLSVKTPHRTGAHGAATAPGSQHETGRGHGSCAGNGPD